MNHDHSYKLLFSEPEMIVDLMRGFVHEEWVGELDFSTLEAVSNSFVSDNLRGREDDVIWRVKHKTNWIYVYLLIEFQSTIDRFMAIRLMVYIGLLYQDLIKKKLWLPDLRLPPIVPIVLYNGAQRWNAATELKDLIVELPGGLEDYLPSLRYLLLDEGAYPHARLAPLKNLVAAVFRLENATSGAEISEVIGNLIEWLNTPEQTRLRRSFSIWIRRVLKPMGDFPTPTNELVEIKAMLAQRIEQWARELKERGLEEGRIEGMKQGKIEGMIEGKNEGKNEGKIEGKIEGEANTLLKQLKLKFGNLPDWVEQQVHQASIEQLDRWVEQVLTATSLEDMISRN